MSRRQTRAFLLALFFLSGITGLIYQIVWTRNLVLVFGNTMLATATVLSAFMGGLAGGSYVLGIYIDRRPRPLIKVYAILEAGIGLFALIFPAMLAAATPLYMAVYPAVDGSMVALNLVRFLVCFILIGIPTFMMGGTLPVLIKYFVGSRFGIGQQTGLLYGLNTTGAVVGTVACGYWLMKNLGMRDSTLVAVVINLGVAAIAWFVAQRLARAETSSAGSSQTAGPEESIAATESTETLAETMSYSPVVLRMVLIGIGLSGFCALAYEVFWTRMLNLFLHNNIYSFTAILATFLIGIAVGSFLYAKYLVRLRDQVKLFVGLQIAIGLMAYITPYIFQLLHDALFNDFAEARTLLKTMAIMFPPTVLMGIAVPLAIQICQRGVNRVGTSVGTVYAVNTVGAILGAFLAGFVLLPMIGLHQGVILVASLNILAGFLPLIAGTQPARRLVYAAGFVALAAVLVLSAPSNLFRGLFEKSHPSAEILHYKEGKVANVVVYDFFKNGYKDMHLNAVEEASSRIWHVQLFKLLGILPPMVHEEPRDALMIAFGAGMSAGATINNVTEFTVVDLNPDIDGIANAFTRENLDVIHNPKLQRVENDGRNALLLSDKKYSLIISDATNPKMFDSWTLYSEEFYQLVKSRLTDDGIFCQWLLIPLPQDSIKVLLNTFRSVFPHMSFWAIYGSSQCLFMGTPERLDIDYEELKARLDPILDSQGLSEFGIDSVEKFLSFHLMGEDAINEMLEGYTRLSTDDLPHAQFHVTQDDVGVQHCVDLVRYQESILSYLSNTESAPEGFEDRIRALDEISRRLNLGFLTGDDMQYEEAAVIAARAGLDDENVKNKFHYDRERRHYFRERVEKRPEDANAHNSLGYIYRMEGEFDAANEEFEEALALKPTMASVHLNLAAMYVEMGEFDAAVDKYLELRAMNPTRTTLREVERQTSIIHLLRRLHFEEDDPATHWALGEAYYRGGRLQGALEAYEKSAELDPQNPEIQAILATLYERHGFAREAELAYAKLSLLRPQDRRIKARQMELANLQRNPARLRDWQNQRIPQTGDGVDDGEHPASCDEALREWTEYDYTASIEPMALQRAASLYERSFARQPEDLHAYIDAATIRESLGDFERAARIWRALAGISEEWQQTGTVNSQRLELLAGLEKGAFGPDQQPTALNQIAGFYRQLGNHEMAIVYLQRSLDIDPDQAVIWETLAISRIDAGLFAAGVEAAAEACRLDPSRNAARTLEENYRPRL